MNSRPLRIALLVIVAVVLQQLFMSKFEVLGIHPDILLLLALCIGVSGGAQRGAIAGFVLGLLHDVFLTSPLGLSALGYTVGCYFVGVVSGDDDQLPWVTGTLVAFGTAIALGIFLLVGRLSGDVEVVWNDSVQIVVIISALNMAVSPFLSKVLFPLWDSQREVSW